MKCKNCGTPLKKKDTSCPSCGTAVIQKKKRSLPIIIISFLLTVLVVFTFFLCGVEIGRRHAESIPQAPDLIAMISDTIQKIAVIPFDVEITQQLLTDLVNTNAENLKPLENVQLTISKDNTLVLSGNITKKQLEEMISNPLPPYISIFLPKMISLYIEAEITNEDSDKIIDLKLKNVTAAGLTFSEELTEDLGINFLLSDVISKIIESEQTQYFKVRKIYLGQSKHSEDTVIIVKGEFNLS